MDEMYEVRSISLSRQVVSVTIIDDSGDEGKPGQLTFSFFMDLPLSKGDTATMNILQEAQAAKVKPVFSFFALRGKNGQRLFFRSRFEEGVLPCEGCQSQGDAFNAGR